MKNLRFEQHALYYAVAAASRIFITGSTIGFVLVVYKWTARDANDPQAWKALVLLYLAGLILCLYLERVLYRYRKRWREQQKEKL